MMKAWRERLALWVMDLGFGLMPHRSKGFAVVIDDGAGTMRCSTRMRRLTAEPRDYLARQWARTEKD